VIVVFGATGTIGGEVLRALVAQGAPVRAAVRSPDRAAALAVLVPTVVADLADPASLPAAVRDAERVFLATPGSEHQVELENALVDALAEAPGRPHLVKLAAFGYDAVPVEQAITLAANHARVVAHVRARGLAHTVLAPSAFMTNLLGQAAAVRAQGALYGSAGDGGLSWVDPVDIAAVAAHVLTSGGHDGASYTVTGPEVLGYAAVAERLSAVTGRAVTYVDVPADGYRASLEGVGLSPWLAGALTELEQLYRAHLAEGVTDEVQKATGRPPTSLDDWLARHRADFT
jgi:uncharacterized protein YbjT (DUF2867 family)